eukprot:CAMPEP_0115566056 /NCGR_PEP_ID=MMETSP0271-20121206/103392_1 /TAXON_ID=71861 /ORGANISM="Scrippsiella trochoidea, Strain CCMP3099" /LENGTH=750 /DNA_ID=CAMNT_0003000361 /DNA_START=57 /DNA_END=2307 /DNA_ORIENTATION=+
MTGDDGCTEFYQPIHDAAYGGHKAAIQWLLEHGADASMGNRPAGLTPLHFVASRGVEPMSDLEEVIQILLDYGADLNKRTDGTASKPGQTPLQSAVRSNSQFPWDQLGLLTPWLRQDVDQSPDQNPLEDICELANHKVKAVHHLIKKMQDTGDDVVLARLRSSAQKPGAVKLMACLLHQAPKAAAEILGMLTVTPAVEDSGHYPLPTRADLRKFRFVTKMRCAYESADKPRTEHKHKLHEYKLPMWEYEALSGKAPPWHQQLVGESERSGGPEREDYNEHTEEVKVMHLGPPLEARGAMRIVFDFFELAIQIEWGLRGRQEDIQEQRNSPLNAPFSWCIVAAGCLRDWVNMIWWIHTHCSRRRSTRDHPALHDVWSPRAFFNGAFLLDLLSLLVKTFFVCTSLLRFIMDLRFTSIFGENINNILRVFFSEAIGKMIILLMLLLSTFSIWRREENVFNSLLVIYKGLLYADGDALNTMGIDIDIDHDYMGPITALCSSFSVFVLNVCMLNLITGIYSNEYDRLKDGLMHHFLRSRAGLCCEFLLGLQKLCPGDEQPQDEPPRRWPALAALYLHKLYRHKWKLICPAALAVGLYLVPHKEPEMFLTVPKRLVSAVFLAAFQVLAQALLLASPWFPRTGTPEDLEQGPENYLWMIYRSGGGGDRREVEGASNKQVEVAVRELQQEMQGVKSDMQADMQAVRSEVQGLQSMLRELVDAVQAGRLAGGQVLSQSSRASTSVAGEAAEERGLTEGL